MSPAHYPVVMTDAAAPVPRRGRGRPAIVDAEAVGMVALRLFTEFGLENVTMHQIAEAAEISRRTLFRLFPTKASIVWGGMSEFTAVLERELANAVGDNVVTLLHRSWVAAMHSLDTATEITRLRLRIIASSAAIRAWGFAQLEESGVVLEAQVARLEDLEPGSLRARLISTALLGSTFAALSWWASGDDHRTPAEVIDESFTELERIFSDAAGKP
jgi:AcrR family transcriptional regulator